MSTNSLIGVQQSDGSIRAVTCHWDGYPEWVGAILQEHYNTEEKANALISLGDLSSLGMKLCPDKEFDEPQYQRDGPAVRHSFETPQKDVTVAYHRDRGDKLEIITCHTEARFMRMCKWCEYRYLFIDGEWEIIRGHLD